jgi:hypothetical protein
MAEATKSAAPFENPLEYRSIDISNLPIEAAPIATIVILQHLIARCQVRKLIASLPVFHDFGSQTGTDIRRNPSNGWMASDWQTSK